MAGLSPEGIAAAQAAVARMERGEFDDEALAIAVSDQEYEDWVAACAESDRREQAEDNYLLYLEQMESEEQERDERGAEDE